MDTTQLGLRLFVDGLLEVGDLTSKERHQIEAHISTKRETTVDVIYLSGGGAELVYEQVIEAYPQTKLVPDAQMANARGYLHYAHFSARK